MLLRLLQVSAVAATFLGVGEAVCQAQPVDQRRPAYQSMRFEEDWSVLQDPELRTEAWDPWKYVPMARSGWFLTLAGEARSRYELLDNPGFGTGPTDRTGYLLQRYLSSVDAHLGRRVRLFAELQSGLANGRDGGARPTDVNRLDLHQGFVDVMPHRRGRSALTVRLGRQEIALGSGRLISAAEGLNVRRGFDGVRAIYRRNDWSVNAGWFRQVKPLAGAFDDVPDKDVTFWGLGLIGQHHLWRGAGFSAYYFGLERQHATLGDAVGHAVRHTAGSRLWRAEGAVDFNHEAIVQWGVAQGRRIRAWGASSDTGVTIHARLKPRIGVRLDAASGDRRFGDSELNAFDPLFPSAIAYSGNSGLLGPTNLIDVAPTVRLSPAASVVISVGAPVYWRQSTEDGVYAITGAVVAPPSRSSARYVGTNPDVTLNWQIDRHTTVTILYSRFFAGAFLRDTIDGRNVNYAFSSISYRF